MKIYLFSIENWHDNVNICFFTLINTKTFHTMLKVII